MIEQRRLQKSHHQKKKKNTTVYELIALGDHVQVLSRYEDQAAKLAQEYEEKMVRF